jgi:putative oxidoreductase
VAEEARSKGRTIGVWVLRVLLGLAFLTIGTTKVTGTTNTVEFFAAIGWGQWFRYLTGILDILGAALIFVPRWTFYGAVVLTGTVGLGMLLSFNVMRNDPTWGEEVVVAPAVLTLLAALLAWLTRPQRTG